MNMSGFSVHIVQMCALFSFLAGYKYIMCIYLRTSFKEITFNIHNTTNVQYQISADHSFTS